MVLPVLMILMSLFLGFPAMAEKLPIIFHKKYDISFWGLEKFHPFDSKKYGKVYRYLTNHVGLQPEQFYTPARVTNADLLIVHTQDYLDSLNSSSTIARIAEVGVLSWVPNSWLQSAVLEPMRLATGGTVLGAQLALENGWAINLAGGYHHAKRESGDGFCFFADIPLAINKLWQQNPDLKVMVVDLDAHQGNGTESIIQDDPRVAIFDVYNSFIYPQDMDAKQYIRFDYPVRSGIADAQYLQLLDDHLARAIDEFQPNLIIYNAGTDIFEHDKLGQMKISAQGIIKRDAFVFGCARARSISILMVLSGGYTMQSAEIIGKSIENLLKNVLKVVGQ